MLGWIRKKCQRPAHRFLSNYSRPSHSSHAKALHCLCDNSDADPVDRLTDLLQHMGVNACEFIGVHYPRLCNVVRIAVGDACIFQLYGPTKFPVGREIAVYIGMMIAAVDLNCTVQTLRLDIAAILDAVSGCTELVSRLDAGLSRLSCVQFCFVLSSCVMNAFTDEPRLAMSWFDVYIANAFLRTFQARIDEQPTFLPNARKLILQHSRRINNHSDHALSIQLHQEWVQSKDRDDGTGCSGAAYETYIEWFLSPDNNEYLRNEMYYFMQEAIIETACRRRWTLRNIREYFNANIRLHKFVRDAALTSSVDNGLFANLVALTDAEHIQIYQWLRILIGCCAPTGGREKALIDNGKIAWDCLVFELTCIPVSAFYTTAVCLRYWAFLLWTSNLDSGTAMATHKVETMLKENDTSGFVNWVFSDPLEFDDWYDLTSPLRIKRMPLQILKTNAFRLAIGQAMARKDAVCAASESLGGLPGHLIAGYSNNACQISIQ
jgi:hypothetical protein